MLKDKHKHVRRCKKHVHMNTVQRLLHPFLKHTLFIKIYFGCCLGKALFSDCPWPPQGRASLYELQRQACVGRRHGDKVTYPAPTPPQPLPPDVTPVNVPHCLDLIYTPAHSEIKAPSCSIHTASLGLRSQGCRLGEANVVLGRWVGKRQDSLTWNCCGGAS